MAGEVGGATTTYTASQFITSNDPETQVAINALESIIAKYLEGGVSTTDGKTGPTGTTGAGGTAAPQLEKPKDYDPDNLSGLIMLLQSKNSDEQMRTAKEFILKNKDKLKSEHNERIEKLKDAVDAAAKAAKSGIFGKIFGWIGAICSMIIGAILCATGGGAVAGGLMIAAATIMLAQMITQEAGGFDQLAKSNPKAAMALMITMAVLSAALAISAGGATIASDIEAISNAVLKAVNFAAQFTSGLSTMGGGAAGIATSVYNKDAAFAQADAKEIQGFILKLQKSLEDEQDKLKDLLDKLDQGFNIVSDIVKQHSETVTNIFSQMSA